MKIKYATIVPLIGGMTVGNELAVGTPPSAFLSYDEFSKNDSHVKLNYPDIPFFNINKDNTLNEEDQNSLNKIGSFDFVSTVCPCSGLSTLNAGNRGANAPQNEWMYKTARYVFENLKPRVFWGENAPALGTISGKPVADRLYNIGKEYGYSLTIIKTDTRLHGIPQRRTRTFYVFWDSPNAPQLNGYSRDSESLTDFIDNIPQDLLYSDEYVRDDFNTNGFLKWFYSKSEYLELFKGNAKTVTHFAKKFDLWDDLINFLEKKGTASELKFARHAKMKVKNGKNYWDSSPYLLYGRDYIQAIQGRIFEHSIHHNNKRYLSIREHMSLMGLPYDYQLTNIKHSSNITQNVPTCTARDWTYEIIKYLNNKLKFTDKDRIIFDNIKEAKILNELAKHKIKSPLF